MMKEKKNRSRSHSHTKKDRRRRSRSPNRNRRKRSRSRNRSRSKSRKRRENEEQQRNKRDFSNNSDTRRNIDLKHERWKKIEEIELEEAELRKSPSYGRNGAFRKRPYE